MFKPINSIGRHHKYIACFFCFMVIAFFAFEYCSRDMCGNRVLREVTSPNGQLKAVVFIRDCGATTSFSTQVIILSTGEALPDSSKGIFVIDPGFERSSTAAVEPRWATDNHLLIEHEDFCRIFRADTQVHVSRFPANTTVDISYQPFKSHTRNQ